MLKIRYFFNIKTWNEDWKLNSIDVIQFGSKITCSLRILVRQAGLVVCLIQSMPCLVGSMPSDQITSYCAGAVLQDDEPGLVAPQHHHHDHTLITVFYLQGHSPCRGPGGPRRRWGQVSSPSSMAPPSHVRCDATLTSWVQWYFSLCQAPGQISNFFWLIIIFITIYSWQLLDYDN